MVESNVSQAHVRIWGAPPSYEQVAPANDQDFHVFILQEFWANNRVIVIVSVTVNVCILRSRFPQSVLSLPCSSYRAAKVRSTGVMPGVPLGCCCGT